MSPAYASRESWRARLTRLCLLVSEPLFQTKHDCRCTRTHTHTHACTRTQAQSLTARQTVRVCVCVLLKNCAISSCLPRSGDADTLLNAFQSSGGEGEARERVPGCLISCPNSRRAGQLRYFLIFSTIKSYFWHFLSS